MDNAILGFEFNRRSIPFCDENLCRHHRHWPGPNRRRGPDYGFLFEQKANVEGLEEKVTRGQFGMTIQASWRASECNEAAVINGLAGLARALGMEIQIRFLEPRRRQRFAILVTREPHSPHAPCHHCAAC